MGIGLSYGMAVRDTIRDGLGKTSARDLSYASLQVPDGEIKGVCQPYLVLFQGVVVVIHTMGSVA
jgi:hypothetical protein